MEHKKLQIKYNDLLELLKHHLGDIILDQLNEWEITVVDDGGHVIGRFVLDNRKLKRRDKNHG
jgi:hypothetical protein